MAGYQLRVVRLATVLTILCAQFGCASLQGEDRYSGYGDAFATALIWRFVKEFTGKDFITFLDGKYDIDGPFDPKMPFAPVTPDTLPQPWISNWGGYALATTIMSNDCKSSDGCIELEVSPELLKDNRYRSWILDTLERPCDYVLSPNNYPNMSFSGPDGYSYGVTMYGASRMDGRPIISLFETWRNLGCGTAKPRGAYNLHIDESTGRIRFSF